MLIFVLTIGLIVSLAVMVGCGIYMFDQYSPLKIVIPGACLGLVSTVGHIIALIAQIGA